MQFSRCIHRGPGTPVRRKKRNDVGTPVENSADSRIPRVTPQLPVPKFLLSPPASGQFHLLRMFGPPYPDVELGSCGREPVLRLFSSLETDKARECKQPLCSVLGTI